MRSSSRFITCITLICLYSANASARDQFPYGNFDIWEDMEGGLSCNAVLLDEVSIGGKALEIDQKCLDRIEFGGEPIAWFIDDSGDMVIVDALRKPIMKLKGSGDHSYYIDRQHQGLESINITPYNPANPSTGDGARSDVAREDCCDFNKSDQEAEATRK